MKSDAYEAAFQAYIRFKALHSFGMLDETGIKVAEVAIAMLNAISDCSNDAPREYRTDQSLRLREGGAP